MYCCKVLVLNSKDHQQTHIKRNVIISLMKETIKSPLTTNKEEQRFGIKDTIIFMCIKKNKLVFGDIHSVY